MGYLIGRKRGLDGRTPRGADHRDYAGRISLGPHRRSSPDRRWADLAWSTTHTGGARRIDDGWTPPRPCMDDDVMAPTKIGTKLRPEDVTQVRGGTPNSMALVERQRQRNWFMEPFLGRSTSGRALFCRTRSCLRESLRGRLPALNNVHGMEYGFGAHEFAASGVFEVEPKSCPGFVYRRSVWMGTTNMSRIEFRSFIENLAGMYNGNTYHLISKNCNHFTDDVCKNLTRKSIPGWVNRLARLGSFFNCLLPESIQVSAVRNDPTHPTFSDDDMHSVSSSIIGDSDVEELDQHLLPSTTDVHSIDVPPKLAKDLL